MWQLQDLHIKEKEDVNEALILLCAQSIQQSTAARPGMYTKTRHDSKSARWKKETENPLRVRDVVHKVRKLVLRDSKGAKQVHSCIIINVHLLRVAARR